jgi:DNA-binding NarL/FixJ family response regulator
MTRNGAVILYAREIRMRILIADDHGVVREGLKALIDNEADMEVVGEAEDGLIVAQLAK